MKTTVRHFEIFKSECLRWIGIFGLKDWRIEFSNEEYVGGGARASIWFNCSDRAAHIYLEPAWCDEALSDKNLRLSAFHEVCEILIAPLRDKCSAREYSENDLSEAGHTIIRILESVLYPKY